jgi:hypothetical protein
LLLGAAGLGLAAVTLAWSTGDAPQTSMLVVTKLSGTKTTITDENFLSTDPTSGIKKTPFSGDELMVDPDNNQLVLVLTSDPAATEGNFSAWTLEEWTKDAVPVPFDRDPVTGGVQAQILRDEDNYGRAFIVKHLKDPLDLKHASIQASSDLEEADASRFGSYPLGDHLGYFTFKGHLDKEGTGKISDISGVLLFQADVLKLPQDDSEQAQFSLKIKAVQKF